MQPFGDTRRRGKGQNPLLTRTQPPSQGSQTLTPIWDLPHCIIHLLTTGSTSQHQTEPLRTLTLTLTLTLALSPPRRHRIPRILSNLRPAPLPRPRIPLPRILNNHHLLQMPHTNT